MTFLLRVEDSHGHSVKTKTKYYLQMEAHVYYRSYRIVSFYLHRCSRGEVFLNQYAISCFDAFFILRLTYVLF